MVSQGSSIGADHLIRFSTDMIEPSQRGAYWQDLMGRTLTGCRPSAWGEGDLSVDFELVLGETVRIARTRLHHIRNNRDRACLADGDDGLVFFLVRHGSADVDHNDQIVSLAAGDGVLGSFDRTLDTRWPDADLLLLQFDRTALRGLDPRRAAGIRRRGDHPMMRLLRVYAETSWAAAAAGAPMAPMMERHLAELVTAICSEPAAHDTGGVQAARVARMRAVMAARFANPCLKMRDVAADVGLSERSGHLAFEQAGLSFTEELQRLRLDRARDLLLGSAARVVDAAFAVGFSDLSHFHRLFRRRFGCTPGDIRAANGALAPIR